MFYIKKLFYICDIFDIPKHGIVIIGKQIAIQNDQVDKNDIMKLITKKILIINQSGEDNTFDVISKEVMFSCFSYDFTIAICLGHDVKINLIERDSIVYSLDES